MCRPHARAEPEDGEPEAPAPMQTVVVPSEAQIEIGRVMDIAGSSSRIILFADALVKIEGVADPSLAMGGKVGSQVKVRVAATWLIATIISKTIGFRVFRDDELNGLDTTFHAESAYDITGNSNRY